MNKEVTCPQCGAGITLYKNPLPTVDALIYAPDRGLVLIKRRFDPPGWALPGGFVEYGESVENAVLREAREETSLNLQLIALLGVYSEPARDPRRHTISTVFIASALNPEELSAGDDAGEAAFFSFSDLPQPLAFDHAAIVADFRTWLDNHSWPSS